MKILKNKKAEEGTEKPLAEIIGWIIAAALVIFAFLWYSGLGNKIIEISKSLLK